MSVLLSGGKAQQSPQKPPQGPPGTRPSSDPTFAPTGGDLSVLLRPQGRTQHTLSLHQCHCPSSLAQRPWAHVSIHSNGGGTAVFPGAASCSPGPGCTRHLGTTSHLRCLHPIAQRGEVDGCQGLSGSPKLSFIHGACPSRVWPHRPQKEEIVAHCIWGN